MRPQEIAPIGMIVLSVLSCIGYAIVHDWRHAIYWAASAALIASVTF
jgi:hypothetical protein